MNRGWNFGRGRGRGYSNRRGGRGDHGGHNADGREGTSHGRGQRGREERPRGLRGKEIGLWHARKGRQRREEEEMKQRPVIRFENNRELLLGLKFCAEKLGCTNDSGAEEFQATEKTDVMWRRGGEIKNEVSLDIDIQPGSDIDLDISDDNSVDAKCGNFYRGFPERSEDASSSAVPVTADCQDSADPDDVSELLEEQAIFSEYGKKQNLEPLFRPKSLVSDSRVDASLRLDLERRRKSEKVLELLQFRQGLPAYQRQKDFIDLVNGNRVVVVSGLTGCGKSTQLPQALLDYRIECGDGSKSFVVCTQPRRISAISLAERVAVERGESLKDSDKQRSVGYQIRLEARLPRDQGSLLYCTTGIVLRWLTSDPMLSRASHLFLDEIHERDLQSDLLLILIRDLLKRRTDLRIILMSATLEADTFLNYFAVLGAVKFDIAGRSFPVDSYFLEDVYQLIGYRSTDQSRNQYDIVPSNVKGKWQRQRYYEKEKRKRERHIRALRQKKYSRDTEDGLMNWKDDEKIDAVLVRQLTRHLCEKSGKEGAILIFVPGMQDIKDVLDQFKNDPFFNPCRFVILPLHSMIPTSDQQKVFARPPSGCRKIVVSTNIAETSVTIDDVVFVVDSGKIKRQNFDKELNCQTLKAEWVSKANAVQRQGRAGRCQPGICYHLFPSWKFHELDERSEPEMRRTRLTSLCLEIKALTKNFCRVDDEDSSVLAFLSKAVDPPDEESVKLALDDLYAIGALTSEEEMTPLGWHLLKLPVDPHCGKMIIYSALFSCVDPVLTIAACLDYKTPFHQPIGKEARVDDCKWSLRWPSDDVKSDYLMWVTAYNNWAWAPSDEQARQFAYKNFLSLAALRFIKKMKKQFCELLFDAGFTTSSEPMNPDMNVNSGSEKVIEAVVAAGLYPKVACVWKQLDKWNSVTSSRPPGLRVRNGQIVKIHPSSVNTSVTHFETRHLVYQTAVKSSAYFLHECAMVSPLALCLSGGHLQRVVGVLILDGWIKFYAEAPAYATVVEMRKLLFSLLKRRLALDDSSDKEMIEAQSQLMNIVCDALKHEKINYDKVASSWNYLMS